MNDFLTPVVSRDHHAILNLLGRLTQSAQLVTADSFSCFVATKEPINCPFHQQVRTVGVICEV